MKAIKRIFGDEKFLSRADGSVESVLLSTAEYLKIVEFLEDQKLVDYIKEAEVGPFLSKEDALRYLESD